MFDYYLAPYVSLSFAKHVVGVAKIKLDLTDEQCKELKTILLAYRDSIDDKRIMCERNKIHKAEVAEVTKDALESMGIRVGSKRLASLLRYAYDETYDETFQSMEAFVHNLNTMHCLPASEKIWVYDMEQNRFRDITMQELDETFKKGRYKAVSLNPKSGTVELKLITASARKDNNRVLVTIYDESGRKVTVTDNHRVLTVMNSESGLERITEDIPSNIDHLIVSKLAPDNMGVTGSLVLDAITLMNQSSDKVKDTRFKAVGKVKIREKVKSNSGDEYVYDISVEDNENFMTYEGAFVHNSRAGRSTVYMVDVPVTWETLCPAV